MMTLKIGEKELKIKYGYEATLKTRLLSKMAEREVKEKENEKDIENIENLLLFLPEFLLIGLQKFHFEEYGFEWESGEGKEKRLPEMFALIDEYIDSNENEDVLSLYYALMDEMLKNGFLKSMYQKELSKAAE